MSGDDEVRAVGERYARRGGLDRYSMLRPDVWQAWQERQRAMLRLFVRMGRSDLAALHAFEVGCGSGVNLLDFVRMGFSPERLAGVELLSDRVAMARRVLPAGVAVHSGDALELTLPPCSQDIVLASTVFSSLLDQEFQRRLAEWMWALVKPGGAVLWYDFTVDNPRNPDVRGVPLGRISQLFPGGRITSRRITLAPPLARAATALHPGLYTALNILPLLRTHLLCWIAKD